MGHFELWDILTKVEMSHCTDQVVVKSLNICVARVIEEENCDIHRSPNRLVSIFPRLSLLQ